MIQLTKGNLLQANVEALVNTVNTVGVMGKGIALQFKEKFEENYKLYKKAAEGEKIHTGEVFIVPSNRMDGIKWIINFPTKKHWRNPSKLEYIETGLNDLIIRINELDIKSIAMPPLGCGNGGLDWSVVKDLIIEKFKILPEVNVLLYEPSNIAYDETLEKANAKPKLTPTRALILYLMRSYAQFGYSLTVLETQKLVYFLSRLGEDELAKIQFQKHVYGPYAPVLNHVLYDIDGFYIKGMKYKDVKTFDYLEVLDKNYFEVVEFVTSYSTNIQKKRIEILLSLIEGFETPLSMELLSTVDFVIKNEVVDKENLAEIVEKVQSWNERKRQLMTEEFITVAYKRLIEFKENLYS